MTTPAITVELHPQWGPTGKMIAYAFADGEEQRAKADYDPMQTPGENYASLACTLATRLGLPRDVAWYGAPRGPSAWVFVAGEKRAF